MKSVIIVLIIVVIVLMLSGLWYYKTVFYVPDKDGSVYTLTDSIVYCCYSSSGSMSGEYIEATVYQNDNAEVWLKYEYRYPVGIPKEDETFECPIDPKALSDIRDVCKRYGVLGWGKLKLSHIQELDGATDEIVLCYADQRYYRFNSGYCLPDGGEAIFKEIADIMETYRS